MKYLLIALAGIFALVASVGSSQAQAKPWGHITDVNSRFVVLPEFGNAAVLDRSTGLIWEKSPSNSVDVWSDKIGFCMGRVKGDSPLGWRMPKWEEMGTLFNVTISGGPGAPTTSLPEGHPFTVSAGNYWTMSPNPNDPADARIFGVGTFSSQFIAKTPTALRVWCVRGGAN